MTGARTNRVCPNCGNVEYLTPYEAKRKKYCSRECASEYHSNQARTKRGIKKCLICGKGIDSTRKYCSKECLRMVDRRKPMSDKRRMRCSKKWQQIRKTRISNFGNTCPISLEREPLEVHHIDLDWSNNNPENLIPLWQPLHRLITARGNYDEFYEARDRAILSSITKAWNEYK